MKMFLKGQNGGIFGNPNLNKISVTGKAMGPIESASEVRRLRSQTVGWENFSVYKQLRTHPYNSSHISPTNRILKLGENMERKLRTKHCELTAELLSLK